VRAAGIEVRFLVLDRAFYSVAVIRYLRTDNASLLADRQRIVSLPTLRTDSASLHLVAA
jgi:hypothetical protein